MSDYEEDFEDYPEDFENFTLEDDPKPLPKTAQIAESKPIFAPSFANKIKTSNENESKHSGPGYRSNTSSTPSSWAGTLKTGPLRKRIDLLVKNTVLDLQEEKSTQLNILPSSLSDIYYRKLRVNDTSTTTSSLSAAQASTSTGTASAGLRQIGTSMREDVREMETMTDEIIMIDKEIQFSCGSDDTVLLNLMNEIMSNNKVVTNVKSKTTTNPKSGLKSILSQSVNTNNFQIATKLSSFLQNATMLCESVLDYKQTSDPLAQPAKPSLRHSLDQLGNTLLDINSTWKGVADDDRVSMNELIVNRPLSSYKISPLQPYLAMTAHRYPISAEDIAKDLRPYKGIYCIWDMTQPRFPKYVLESSGQPTDCHFSSQQVHIVVAGTEEGNVCVWDLSKPTHLHMDKDAEDLKIDKGIRKPCYTTVSVCLSSAIYSDEEASYTTSGRDGPSTGHGKLVDTSVQGHAQHMATVIQIEPIGHSFTAKRGTGDSSLTPSSSHFASLDLSGVLFFWVSSVVDASARLSSLGVNPYTSTTNSSSTLAVQKEDSVSAMNAVFGLSPWSSIALVPTHKININTLPLTLPLRSSWQPTTAEAAENKTKQSSPPSVNTKRLQLGLSYSICVIPGETSSVYLTGNYSTSHSCPTVYKIDRHTGNYDIFFVGPNTQSSSSPSVDTITCLAVRENCDATSATPIVKAPVKRSEGKEQETKDASDAPTTNTTTESPLSDSRFLLVGLESGQLSLYADSLSSAPSKPLDTSNTCLYTWDTAAFSASHTSATSQRSTKPDPASQRTSPHRLVHLQWCRYHPASFFAINASGILLYFNLIIDPHTPLVIEALPYSLLSTPHRGVLEEYLSTRALYHIGYNTLTTFTGATRRDDMTIMIPYTNKYNINIFQYHIISVYSIKVCVSDEEWQEENYKFRLALTGWARGSVRIADDARYD